MQQHVANNMQLFATCCCKYRITIKCCNNATKVKRYFVAFMKRNKEWKCKENREGGRKNIIKKIDHEKNGYLS